MSRLCYSHCTHTYNTYTYYHRGRTPCGSSGQVKKVFLGVGQRMPHPLCYTLRMIIKNDLNTKEHSLAFRMTVTFIGGVVWILIMSAV